MKFPSLERTLRSKSYEGWVEYYRHESTNTQTEMKFAVYLPPQSKTMKLPVLYWLSGLTCTEENFVTKAGACEALAKHGIILVACDTSPRGAGVEGENSDWDIGTGAGFYVNATEGKWAKNYRMYDYITRELPDIIEATFPVLSDRRGIFGHSMGGHGAIVAALREPGRYQSVSAFSPIAAPSLCPWGEKAFTAYLGNDRSLWEAYDAHCLVRRSEARLPILIDQGTDDKFLKDQLLPEQLKKVCDEIGYPLDLRMRPGYDHSYYFISTFVADHIAYHAAKLKN